MHLDEVKLRPEKYPTREYYPFNLPSFYHTRHLRFSSPITLFVGENGTGKSTLLTAIARKCGIHIWENADSRRLDGNPYENALYRYLSVCWRDAPVPGSFFCGETFNDFARFLEGWSVDDPGMLDYFGGRSLLTQSHGQSLMAYFKSRYAVKGLYLLDEPETALSPHSQLELLKILTHTAYSGQVQFIIASHSPILLGCPQAIIYNFDAVPIKRIDYEETDHFQIYRDFIADRSTFLEN